MACTNVKQELAKFKKEEQKLNKSCCDPTSKQFGMFWAHTETRPYYQALTNLISKYATIDSKQSAREGILHCMKLLYYSRKDTLSNIDFASNLLLRIDQDQLAFDLIRWYARDIRHSLGKPSEPYLTDWQCDRSEDLFGEESNSFMTSTHVADYALIKLRMLFYLHDLDAIYRFLAFLKRERRDDNVLAKLSGTDRVLHLIKDFVLGPKESCRGRFSCRDKSEIQKQILSAFKYGEQQSNPRIWKAIVNPQPLLEQAPPTMRFPGTAEDCYRTLEIVQYTWYASGNLRALTYLQKYVMANGGTQYDARCGR